MTPFGTFAPGSPATQGFNLLSQLRKQGFGGGAAPGAGGGAGLPGAPDASGTPNFISNGLIAKLMNGNQGGLLSALFKRPQPAPQTGFHDEAGFAGMGGGQPMGGMGMLSGLFNNPMPPPSMNMTGTGGW